MIEQMLTEVCKFFASHSKLLVGTTVNLILIYVFCKIADAFNKKLENK